MEDGKQMGTMTAWGVRTLAVSTDGRWIAAGTYNGHAIVWDAITSENALTHWEDLADILGVDFSTDSTRLVTASRNRTGTVRDVATGERVSTFYHEDLVIAAKYSPQGDRIVTATRESVQVWDSNDGRLLADIPVKLTPWYNTGLLWSDNHLFVISANTIIEVEASTGSAVSEWPVHDSNSDPCFALPNHGEFIAYSTNDTVTLWDTSTHSRIGLIQHPEDIYSIALSPDGRFVAIGGHGRKITIKDLRDVLPSRYPPVSIVYSGIWGMGMSYCQPALLQWYLDKDTDHLVSLATTH